MKKQVIGTVFLGGIGIALVMMALRSGNVVARDVPDELPMVKVMRAQVGVQDTSTLTMRGVVRDAQEVYLAPKASGRVTHLFANIGDRVVKGQRLAVIDGTELWAQTQTAQTGLASANEAVKETKDYFAAQVRQAKKARSLAHDAYTAARARGDHALIAKTRANYELAKKAYDAAKEGRDLQVDIARGSRAVARAQLHAAQTVAANTIVRAPFSGVIASRMIAVGDLVSPERPLFYIVHGIQKQIDLSMAPEHLAQVHVGDIVMVRADDGRSEEARISAVSPVVDPQTRKGLVRVTLANTTIFTLGDYADVTFHIVATAVDSTMDNGVKIPRSALMGLYHEWRVFVVIDGVAQSRVVQIGNDYDDGMMVVVTDGVTEGEQVVVEGQHSLHDGEAVTVVNG